MHTESVERWKHGHTFGQEQTKPGERRTMIVMAITAFTMGLEVAAGIFFGSMALLADGVHMGSHASALAIAVFSYRYTRRHAGDRRFNFGTGKVNSLSAFGSAVLLMVFVLIMAAESVKRLMVPVPIDFNHAIFVAALGLAVNGVCMMILKGSRGVEHSHAGEKHVIRGKGHREGHPDNDFRKDHALWSAYLHVLADLLTSVVAIFALVGGKYWGLVWLDPVVGVMGAVLILRWSVDLLGSSSRVLLDMQAPEEVENEVRRIIESHNDNRVTDLHIWAVGTGIYAVELAVVSSSPREGNYYASLLPADMGFVHMTVEARACPGGGTATKSGEGTRETV